jgi:CRISPR system Cascade subunit CasC
MDKIKPLRIEYHILQSFPVTCLNRDDVGSPKTAIVGGVTRARVSSQCWKREVRLTMQDFGVKIGTRTKNIAALLSSSMIDRGASEQDSKKCAEVISGSISSDSLLFIGEAECNAIAEYAEENGFKIVVVDSVKKKGKSNDSADTDKAEYNEKTEKVLLKEVMRAIKSVKNVGTDALDIALFGRMVAKAADMNVEAASAFSHAISTHKVSNEIDFFTALDDAPSEGTQGSAHMGTLEFNSATYYRYISLDVSSLMAKMDPEDVKKAIDVFTKALYIAVPAARQTTQSGACPWDYAKVYVRSGQRIQASFDEPVRPSIKGVLEPSKTRLNEILTKQEKLAGSLFGKIADYTFGEDDEFSIDQLSSALQRHVV